MASARHAQINQVALHHFGKPPIYNGFLPCRHCPHVMVMFLHYLMVPKAPEKSRKSKCDTPKGTLT
jgi:hypothetical protein